MAWDDLYYLERACDPVRARLHLDSVKRTLTRVEPDCAT